MTRHRHYIVSGRVQGVGFRAFTAKRGETLGLRGRVRNLVDGRVEIVACGSETTLGDFEKAIARGPLVARVDDVVANDIPPEAAPLDGVSGFQRDDDGEAPWQFA